MAFCLAPEEELSPGGAFRQPNGPCQLQRQIRQIPTDSGTPALKVADARQSASPPVSPTEMVVCWWCNKHVEHRYLKEHLSRIILESQYLRTTN